MTSWCGCPEPCTEHDPGKAILGAFLDGVGQVQGAQDTIRRRLFHELAAVRYESFFIVARDEEVRNAVIRDVSALRS